MSVNFNFVKVIKPFNIMPKTNNSISFKACESQKSDTFEKKSKTKDFEMKVYNPYSCSTSSAKVSVDLTKPQKIILTENAKKWCQKEPLILDYDPNRTDFIWDKTKKKPVKVVILKAENGKEEYSYHFMSKNLEKEYGYIHLSNHFNISEDYLNPAVIDRNLFRNYSRYDIIGPRVVVDYLQNWNDKDYGGIGKLADKLSVKHCLEHNMNPVIVSVADFGSHAAHYLRGKRYLPVEPGSMAHSFYKEKYGTANLNKILERLLKQSEKTGEKVDVKDWGYAPMYMPKELVEKYLEEIKRDK